MADKITHEVIGQLRAAAVGLQKSPYEQLIVDPRDQVLARFQPIFSADHVPNISADEFRSFLLFENNRHWTGLQRQGTRMCADMAMLRHGLSTLLAEDRPIAERLNRANDDVHGMGRNIASAVLLVAHPDRYGVWNRPSEAGMTRIGVWPDFERRESLGSRYVKVNRILLALRDALETDLWTLDALWYLLNRNNSVDPDIESSDVLPQNTEAVAAPTIPSQRFGIEQHLHEFLLDNWDHVELGREWTIYSEPGEPEAGYKYNCDAGEIDFLARHKRDGRWLVIELKREQSTDKAVGQLLRYMGFVKQRLAGKDEAVQGLIISRKADKGLQYALSPLPNVEVQLYEVDFRLKPMLEDPGQAPTAASTKNGFDDAKRG